MRVSVIAGLMLAACRAAAQSPCADLFVHEQVDDEMCPKGKLLSSESTVETCETEVCALLTPSTSAAFEGQEGYGIKKDSSGVCRVGKTSGTVKFAVCDSAPPLTTYSQRFGQGFYVGLVYVRDITFVAGSDVVAVASSYDLTFVVLKSGGIFERAGKFNGYYYATAASEVSSTTVYGLQSNLLQIIDVSNAYAPTLVGSTIIGGYGCSNLIEYDVGASVYMYVTCRYYGGFVVDVTDMSKPKRLGNGTAFTRPQYFYPTSTSWSYSYAEGLCLDSERELLFIAYSINIDGVRMFDLKQDKVYPPELDMYAANSDVYQVQLSGTIVFAVAQQELLVLETKNRKFEYISKCCDLGPSFNLRGMYIWEGLAYVSDYNGYLLIMNVTDPLKTFYLGHRDVPSASSYTTAREGIHVGTMKDNVTRVFQAAYSSGFVVWSDIEPVATPAPPTFAPPPPTQPVDCGHVVYQTGKVCSDGLVPMPQHILQKCSDPCDAMNVGTYAVYDGLSATNLYYKLSTSCSFRTYTGTSNINGIICGTPPPLTTYLEVHARDVMPGSARANNVAVLGKDSNDVVVATSVGLTILRAKHSTGFTTVAHVDTGALNYWAVQPSQHDADVLFAVNYQQLDIISLNPVENPQTIGTVKIAPTNCMNFAQIRKGTALHVLYATCGSYGIFAVDVRDNTLPKLLNNGSVIMQLDTGYAKGIVYDEARDLLFLTSYGSGSSVYMYDVAVPLEPELVHNVATRKNAHNLITVGTVAFIAADDNLEIYETKTMLFVALGLCCGSSGGPTLNMLGLDYYDGLVYGSDSSQKLVVMNVTDLNNPWYVGHRTLPQVGTSYSYGREGILVRRLGDGVMRVFQCAYYGGLMVFSDEKPAPTPAPPTPMPLPPAEEPDCSSLYVYDSKANGQDCEDTDMSAPTHVISDCGSTICSKMKMNSYARIQDYNQYKMYYRSSAGTCSFRTSYSTVTDVVCGPAPPFMTYVQDYKSMLPAYSYVRGVDVPDPEGDIVLVAGSYEMSVMRLNDEGWLQKVGKVSNYYYNVLSAEGRPGIAYALRSSYLDVIDYSSDAAPKIISRTLYFGGYSCEYLEQYVADGTATVFISCPLRGIYAVNATTDERHTTFGSTNPVALPRSGQCEGMAVDKVRKLLFVATSAEDDSGVQMYNITTPWSPISLEHSPTTKSAFDVVLDGTMLYVAASTTLEIFETATGKFVAVGICCEVGNNLDFVGLAVYKGVVFASDYIYGQTVVINATDPTKPYYAGHRDLPSSARGKAGIVIAPMKDNAVRIFQSGYLGGLVVFSDKEPGATPVPGTPLPPPPVEPQDCGHIFASETTSCPDGTAMMAQQVLSSCIKTADDLCTSMKAGAIYFFDTTLANRYVAKSATGTCTFKYVYNEVPVGALCGSPAPHTTYLEGHKPGLLPDNAYVRDVVLMGESTKEIAVAHSYGISVLTADGSTGFQHRGTQPGYYYAVLPSADNKDIVFGSRYAYIDIINFAPPETPVRLSFLYYVSYYGYHLEQWYEHGKFHYLYVSADREGVYILDVMNKNAPKKTHATASIQTLNGDTQGMTLDKGREILFVVADGSFSALYAYNVTQPTVPILYGSVGTEWACYELRVSGNIVFVSCDEKLEVFDTTDPVNMTAHSICCQFAGALELRGMELYDGLIYAVDYYRKLVVINVTDTAVPYFVSHRELAPISGKSMLGQVGVAVGALNDGVVRVIVAGYSAGIYALSDTKPPPTPAPPTQIPAPPAIPPNCSQLYVFDTTTASDSSMTCEDGHVLFPKEHIEECMDELCPQISSGDGYAGYDGPNARYMVSKVGATCKFVTSSTKLTKYICGPAPPYTTYLTEYEDGFIPAYALVYAVLPLDPAAKNVMLGTNRGYSIISFQDDGRFRAASSVTATYGYRQMTPVKEEANLVFAVRYYYFDIIDVSDVMNPIQKASLRTTYYCQCVSHYKVDLISVAYVSCDTYGMYVIDASDLTKPASLRVVKPSQGQARGTAVDDDRSLLYMGTESTGFGIATFNLSNPKAPEEINYVPSKGNVYQVRLFGTVLYAATAKGLEIYETKNTGTPEGISTCCNTGPALNLRDMYMYNDMVFAADYYNMMVVVNVTDPLLPHYLGHRDMPTSGYGYAISVNMMDDGNVRVLQGCGSVGLVVGSDAKPMPTPVPQTPLPPPPRPPATDCSQLEILPVTDLENPCPAGSVLASQWLINVCRAKACPDLTTSMVVMIDSSPNVYFLTTNGNTCSTYYKFNTIPTHAACGYAPPHTMYLEMHKEVLDDNAWAIDVAVLENKNDVIVATTTGLTVLHALHSVGFRRVAHVPGDYVAVLAAEGDKDVAYALLIDTFDIIALSPPEEPDVSSSKFLPSDSCVDMVQYRMQNVFHVVYISCGTDGVFAMDTRDDDNAVLLNNGSAVVVTSRSGPSTGLAVDEARKLLFVVTSGSSAGVHMLDIADPFAPSEVAFNHTQYTADDIKVVGTLAYVAAKDKLEIWETTNNEFKQISWCCQNAPALELKGIQYWDGLIYASDYYYKLMVINVTDPFVPEFVAHRRLPYNNGYAYGQKGIAVAEMDDGIVRVFQAARTGGVAIFSDEEPLPTPAPDTPLPPPPMVPPNCDALYVNSMTGNNPCKDGDILMSYHVIDACLPEVCGMLQGGESVGYDEAMSVLSNGGGSCVFEPATATVDRFICGPTPPHTRYMEIYSEYFLPPGSRAVDVCVIGDYQTERDDFLVATSVELTVMHIKNNGRLTKSGSLPNAYTAVVGAREKATMAYALKENGLDVISVEDETKPEVFASVTFGSYQCTNLAQMKNGVLHYVYAACGTSGIFATDVWLNREAKLVGDGAILIPEKGVARGMEVDAKRAILFVAVQNTSGTPGVYMYNIANAGEPAELGFQETDNSANEVLLVDTLLFIAAETQLDMYDTEGGVFTLRGWCCHYGPELHLVGLDYLNGLIYSSDWHGRLIVINVTDPGSSYYAGHRDLPPAAGGVRGKEGILVKAMSDNVVRVVQAADNGGLVVFTDHTPAPTPAPPTFAPAAPAPPLDCSVLRVVAKTDDDCPDNLILENDHVAAICLTAVCTSLPDGAMAMLDSSLWIQKSGSSCDMVARTTVASHMVCGKPPRYTTYVDSHKDDVLEAGAFANDVAFAEGSADDILVATSTGLSVLHALTSTSFKSDGHVDGDYERVLISSKSSYLAYSVGRSEFAVIRISGVPVKQGSLALPSTSCATMAEIRLWSGAGYMYLACGADGIVVVDITNDKSPKLVGNVTSYTVQEVAVDADRGLLFATTLDSASLSSLRMYSILFPDQPRHVDSVTLDGMAGEILLFDTVVYVATGARLDVVQTKAGSLQYVPWCCSTGPTMNIVALAIYEGLLYAADSNSMLVVIDVNDPTAPYYVGHRNLPFSAEATQVSVGKLSDRIPRVLVASPAGGVFVFSDEEPVVTPSPPTRVPPPMKTPPNCDAMYIQAYSSVDDIYCKKGDVLMSYTEIAACSTEVCALVSQSGQSSVGYDAVNRRFTSSTSSCSFSYVFGKATHNVCGPPPPYTAYLQRYDNTFLASYSRAVDVTVVPHGDAVYVATTKELVALQLQPDGNFWRAGYVRENYVAVVPVEGQTGYLFALGPQSLAVIDFKNLATPTVVSEVRVSSYVCANLEQVILNKKHYVFCSCNRDGIFVADASDLQQLKMVKSSALITLPSGPSKGMFVDEGRELLFGVSTSRGVHMYNISDPTSPTVVDSITPDGPAYEIVLVGTLAYVAAGNRLEIYETDGGKFVENGWCCQWSPPVWLVGLDVFNGLAYASDWTASLIVMNVSDSFHPYYIGHREMPAGSGGNSNGKEGLIVAPLSDDTVRVFLAADNGGLVVFSDVEPGPTPSPPTPLPLAPHEPFDCTDYHVVEINDQTDNGCSQGYVPAPDHVVGVCRTHLCTELPEGKFASYDAQHTYYLRNMDGNCGQFYSSNTIATYKVCGPAPPHTSFVEVRQYDIMALANNVKDVAVLGFDKNDIAVAASDGLAILHAFHSTGFKLAAKVPGNYVSVLADSMDPDIVFALKSHYLDIITLTPPESPEVLGTATLNSYACQMMDQYQKGTSIHMMYVACHEQGIFAIDLRNDRDPQNVHGDEAAIHTFTGETKGVRVASDRALLFASTWGTDAAVHMFDLTNHTDPVDITHVQAKYSVFDMVLDGTILFCAASQQVIVYETVDNKFEQIGVCCNERAPVMNMVGLDFFDGFVYASDYNRRLIIINATNPVDPFYIGHREMRPQNGYIASGKEGIVVSALGDGVVRVFQSGNYGGLFIYSDEEPVATLAPPTRAPPPPEVPPNCDAVYVADECSEGDVVISEHVIDACSDEICTQMTDPAGFDGAAGKVYVKTESSCDYQETDTLPTRFVCGPAPPHTAYMSMYDDAVLPKYSRAVDVVVMGPAKDEVIVATTTALVVLQLEDGLFKRHSSITASYVAIIPSDDQPNILYGIRSSSFDVISVLDIQAPEIVATLRLPSYSCSNLEQMVYGSGGLRTVYASCKRDGVFAIDASDNLNPVLANNTAVAKPDGEAKGLLVDQERQLMFVVSSGSSAAVFMHDIAVPSLALQKLSVDTNFSAYELAMDGTILYVAAEATLQIYQTANFKLDLQSYCCSFGPELFIVGIEYYNGMIYASDWRGKLVVMNVTQTSAPYYVGHRDLPSSSGNSNGKEGIIVTSMSDDQVRVFQAADDGGLIVFSDVKPPATPQPDTPLPAPPAPPLNCDDMVVNTKAEGVRDCPPGLVISHLHMVNQCITELCAKMAVGDVATYDGATIVFLKKTATDCRVQLDTSATPTKTVCGMPPPHTAFLEPHKDDVLVGGASAREVAVLGSDSDDIVVATSEGLTILTAWASTGFERAGHVDGNFYAVVAAPHDKDLLYALTPDTLEIVSLVNVREPDVSGRVTIPSQQCAGLEQIRNGKSSHVVYASCHAEGVYAVDVLDSMRPKLLNSGDPVVKIPQEDGEPKGLFVDASRGTLYVASWGTKSGVYTYDISRRPTTPTFLGFVDTDFSVFELAMSGTTLFIAAQDKLEVYDTSNLAQLKQVGWCCNDDETAPNLFIVGLTYFDNMIYASDWNRKIVVFNVTDPANVYYIGHRDLPSKANGKEGIVAAQLQDGIIRVFQAADQGGLMVFSDEEPIMTPSPRTPMPPPPFLPPDCPALYVHEPLVGDDVNPCKEGDILMDRHIVDVCMNDVCQKLADGEMAGFVEGGKAVQKAGTGCSVVDDASLHFRFVCGPAPPYTSYVMQYPAGPYVVDSALVGSDGRYIAASTDTHVMFYRLTSAAYLMEVAKVENPGYKSVVQAKHNPNVVYALRYNALDVIDAQDPTRPAVVGTLPFASTRCARLIQMKTEVTNVLYVSCHDSGIFVVDVRSDTAPMLLNDGNGLTTDEGEVKGVLVDSNRTLLFTVTWGVSALHMFDVSAPAVPVLLATEPTDAAAFEMTQNEFLIYIAAGAELEIVDTSDGKLQRLSSCCSHGPGMWIVGLAFFNNLIYASDWTGKLVVMNVTTGGSPYYVGHRDLPAGSNGKEGVLVADMNDGVTRVLLGGDSGGLFVFSDIAPQQSPAPDTPMPPPPPKPTTCGDLQIITNATAGQPRCPEKMTIMNVQIVTSCTDEVCALLSDGDVAAVDGAAGDVFSKANGVCSVSTGVSNVGSVCGPPAPYTTYASSFSDGVIPSGARALDVAVLGSDSREVVVATTKGLTVLRLMNNKLQKQGTLAGSYTSVISADHNPDIVLAVRPDGLDIVTVNPPEEAAVLGGVDLPSSECSDVAQLRWSSEWHLAYVSCGSDGVFVVDVMNGMDPKMADEAVVVPGAESAVESLFVDARRGLLFVTLSGAEGGVQMYSLGAPMSPVNEGSIISSDGGMSAVTLLGSYLYVAANDTIRVFDTTNSITEVATCCQGPAMSVSAFDHYKGLLYAADSKGKMMVFNVTDPVHPYYVGHKDMLMGVGAQQGMEVGWLADGYTRVFQAAGDAGLIVFSDIDGMGTLPPMTATPNTMAPGTPRTDAPSTYCIPLVLNTRVNESATECKEGFELISGDELASCETEICKKMSSPSTVGFLSDESAFVKTVSGDCSIVFMDSMTTSTFVCKPEGAVMTDAPNTYSPDDPRSAAGGDESGESTGLLVAAIVGPILVMLLCVASLSAVYVLMKRQISRTANEELQDFDYVQTKEFDGPDEAALTDADVLAATVSQNSNYDKL